MSEVSDPDMTSASLMSAPPTDGEGAGAIRKGRIANVGSQDVLIDFGGKSLGAMPLAEFAKGESYQVGDEIEVMIVDGEPRNGLLDVSRRKARQAQLMSTIQAGMVMEGVVTGMNKGGLEVDIQGLRGFIPASQVDLRFMKDISSLLGQTIKAEVTKYDADAGDIVLSRRNLQLKESAERKEHMLQELEVGQIRKGKVRSLSEFGAFVDIGGVDALLHISDMSWGRVNKPDDVVKVGDEIECKITKINKEKKKVSLSLRATLPDPWSGVQEKYPVGTKLSGRVVRMQDFGAFVEIEAGVDGLLPVSELSWTRRVRHPSEIVKEGDVIEVSVIGVDAEKKRISLSLKQIKPDPWSEAASKYSVGSMIKAKVARTADFGAFVALEDGIDGLIHISELANERVKSVTDKVKPGDEVDARVLGVDTVNKKISLSLKPPPRQPTPEELAEMEKKRAADEKERERKRAKQASRRGGITISWDQGLGSLDPTKFAR
ncbi:MAG TPA: S1 RNA-binding domain-containing protein [Phycisphaerae bacterium]|nr:S1 RNA-binding domain-containing protein [Phycisphaerae bacterium]